MKRRRVLKDALRWLAAALLLTTTGAGAAGAAIIAPGYTQSTVATSTVPTGGIAVKNGAILVGVGSFGGATQSIVRIDGGVETVIADGFNSLAGFAYDAVNDRLIVGDNALEATGSETGDTLYAISDPFGRAGAPLRAADIELLTAGSIASTSDLVLDPNDPTGQSLFLIDSASPAGQVLGIDLLAVTMPISVLQTGLGFTGGIAASATTLFMGDLDPGTFTGRLFQTALPGGAGARSSLATSMDGQSDLVLATDGSLLSTSSQFFGTSSVLRIDPVTGALLETVATGFDFATGLTEENGVIYAIEGGFSAASGVLVFTPVPEPGTALALGLGLLVLGARARRDTRRCA